MREGRWRSAVLGQRRAGRLVVALLSLAVLVSGVLTIQADLNGDLTQLYAFKPLTTGLLVLLARFGPAPVLPVYRRAIIGGLSFSLAGDIFLMLPQDRFLLGLVSFLVAHLFYIYAFVAAGGFYRSLAAAGPFIFYGVLIIAVLWSGLGAMRLPALAYMMVILLMAWQALGQWRQYRSLRAGLAFVGALFFLLSDSALAVNRFHSPVTAAPLLILGTYYVAQWLIALSAGSLPEPGWKASRG